ncbi:phage antirepressor N-terminal domain-containing protein [Chitinimonas koreensis]|uniref:phage antirepressor N-terminal domain-containing protein n=1 Tax=Chitinimonas koreensis TaxID=356302 RepID=UPI000A030F4C|nr:phage antirepressor N-terminal domain-containing protein [Chitinimonas koreensis]
MSDVLTAEKVMFQGAALLTVRVDGVAYVAMKPIVEAIGIDWRSQRAKFRDGLGWGDITLPLQTPGGLQQVLCIPLRKLNGWLFSLNPTKVRDDLRERLTLYQEECFAVLHAYWTTGLAARTPGATLGAGAVNMEFDLDAGVENLSPAGWYHLVVALSERSRAIMVLKLLQRGALHTPVALPLREWTTILAGVANGPESVRGIIQALKTLGVVVSQPNENPRSPEGLLIDARGLQRLLDETTLLARCLLAPDEMEAHRPALTPFPVLYPILRTDKPQLWRQQAALRGASPTSAGEQ